MAPANINSALANAQDKVLQQMISTSQQTTQFSSNVSYASATMSSSTATSSKSESVVKSKESQMIHETISSNIQSFTEQESQSLTILTNSPTQKVLSKNDNNTQEIKNEEKNAAVDSVDTAVSAQKNLIKVSENIKNDHEKSEAAYENVAQQKSNIKSEYDEITSNEKISSENTANKFELTKTENQKHPLASSSISNPLPLSPQPANIQHKTSEEKYLNINPNENILKEQNIYAESTTSQTFVQQTKRGITPIPPIKTYNPPEKKEDPVPMPPETKPYIPPDFKINIEPKVPRQETASPMVDALTTVPDRPFTPTNPTNTLTIERGSLKEALTIAPDRPYSPLQILTNQLNNYTSTATMQVHSNSSEIVRPIATQTTNQPDDQTFSELSTIQNTCKLQSSSNISAFKPVTKQIFPPQQPKEFCELTNFSPMSNELKSNFEKHSYTQQDVMMSESKIMQNFTTDRMSTQGFSSVKMAQNYFEQLDQKEMLSSTAVRSKSGLHKPDSLPHYQKNLEQLPSQRGITPELCNAPAVLQRPVTPCTDPPTKPREKSQEPKLANVSTEPPQMSTIPQIKTPVQQMPIQFHKDTPITMTFQPVTQDNILRVSPMRSRSTTPSLINKPAPIIPHYQMNLVPVEYLAPESNLYEPSSPNTSRSPTPKPRSRSPAPGPPPNPLKAQAPRIKETTPQRHAAHSLLTQATSNLRKEHEMAQKGFQSNIEPFDATDTKRWAHDQPLVTKEESHTNVGYKSENYNKGNVQIKEDSMINQNYGQRQMQSQNISEYGNTMVQTTRKTFEEFERTQTAKMIEIRKGGLSSSDHQTDYNIQSSVDPRKNCPPSGMSLSASQQNSSVNLANENVTNTSNKNVQLNPSITGANQGPVCDPTPSTGSSVGAAARGKTFGVSSAPKRGRGILNKAALPGSRVPLCASCNGNIRGPFITALGRIWCPEHFICVNATCRRPLQDIGFVEENGQLYCEYCFEQYIAPACDKCHAKIKGDCLNAIGKHFHPECFNCVYCGKLFGNNPFFLEDGLPYCEADWNELFTTKCFACGFPVEAGDRWVEALNNNYHSQCFNCTVCKKNLEGQSFFAKGGRPFCKVHAR